MTDTTRRILLITGAGASANLGAAGAAVPQMGEWARTLANDIDEVVPHAADTIGIRADMPGMELETNLGKFLAYERLLPTVEQLAAIACATTTSKAHATLADPAQVQLYLRTAATQNRSIVDAIRANLFRSFGPRRIDTMKARSAYQTLFQRLESPFSLAVATTNYDHAIERGLSGFTAADGRQVFTSDRFYAPYEGGTKTLDPTEVAAMYDEFDQGARGDTLRVPLMHLHGAVGWYLDKESGFISQPHALDLDYQPGGAPALLLPDSTKSAYSLPGGEELWNQFRLIANAASHILFLGHSLHDEHILRIVKDRPRQTKVGVFWHAGKGQAHFSDEDREHVDRAMPGGEVILGEFGPEPRYNEDAFRAWLAP